MMRERLLPALRYSYNDVILPLRSLIPVVLVLGASGLAWVLAPDPVPPKSDAAGAESWSLPPIQRREPAKWAAKLRTNSLWGVEAAGPEGLGGGEMVSGGGPAGTTGLSRWSIVGTVIQGQDVFALITVGEGPSKQYRVGDTTPDGAKILRIEEDRLHISNNGAESVLEVYRK